MSSTSPNISFALSSIPTREHELPYGNISSNASLYAVDLSIPVKADDYLGIGQLVPSTMHFYDVGNYTEAVYYYRTLLASSFNLEEEVANPLIPLVTAIISRKLKHPSGCFFLVVIFNIFDS